MVAGTIPGRARRGFTLIELVIVVSILTVLFGLGVTVVSDQLAKTRDVRRVEDLKAVARAIEEYLADTGGLPDGDPEPGGNGWDTTSDGSFLTTLVTAGYLREQLSDPLGGAYMYRYAHYPRGYEGFTSDFYVIGIQAFETPKFDGQTGHWQGSSRDWSLEFAYVIGGTSR